ncbi:MAG: family 43 glycosylhydrolase [Phycisphaerae bacterium]|nr:family 43 glycosylhydrolase [Phycisphaerae bacterium]
MRTNATCIRLTFTACSAIVLCASPSWADNPIVQHVYTADPAPVVYGDTVYLCTSHDEDVTVDNFFTMNDWRVFSSKDMVNWTDHGSPLSYKTFSWAKGKAWAPQCVMRDGKYYFYVPVSDAIGVAVADSPIGPFKDAIGRQLVSNYQYIDPTVFIDDDDQTYLYFGNPNLWHVKLNADMISYSGQVEKDPMSTASFGQRSGDADRPTLYEEGPWFFKRSGTYYMMFAMGPLPEKIGYSTATGPVGPWTYRGVIMNNESGHAFTNHAGVIDFKDHSYFFYHTQELPGGGGYKRSVAVEEFRYNADGSFPTIRKTAGGVTESVAPLNPYARVEGETICVGKGIEVEDSSAGGRTLASIENGDSVKVESVDFGTGPTAFEASVASETSGGKIELHLDTANGTLLGNCTVPGTGSWQTWQKVSCDVTTTTGVHDLFLVFTGGSGLLFNLDFWQFTPKDPISGTGGAGGGGGSGLGGGAGTANSGGMTSGGSGSGGIVGGGTTATGGRTQGSGGRLATGGMTASGGFSASGGVSPAGGANASGGAPAAGGLATTGGGLSTGGALGSGGRLAEGGTTVGQAGTGSNGSLGGQSQGAGGSTGAPASGGTSSAVAGSGEDSQSSGCGCAVPGSDPSRPLSLLLGLFGALMLGGRRQRR